MRDQLILGALVVLLLGWYLTFSASRLDRLHHRVEGTRATLDAQLVRRAEAAIELATSGLLDPATGLFVAGAASDALSAGEVEVDPQDRQTFREHIGEDPVGDVRRESAESELSQALQVALAEDAALDQARRTGVGADLVQRLATACHRVQLARRFHNQAVTDAQRVRRKRVVRWAHLAGRAALPKTFEMDDEPPAALSHP